ncbi:hypothetical protein HHI36_005497 [Cryptolaemus montrouzieri]|uniref:Uncharacterized protein n=1 Tax=Cryptolaemus montrouzieri TaxID=559131 RepID=A0ABD2NUT7_9CUCU
MLAPQQIQALKVVVPDVSENASSFKSDDLEEVPLYVLKTKSSEKKAEEEIGPEKLSDRNEDMGRNITRAKNVEQCSQYNRELLHRRLQTGFVK